MGIAPILAGGGAAGQTSKSTILLLNASWAGNVLVATTGIVGLAYLFYKRTDRRSWLIISLAFVADTTLTTVFHWLSEGAKNYDPLALWPYVLGTTSTLLVGIVLGVWVGKNPLRLCCGFASMGLLFASVANHSLPLTLALLSRIATMYGAAVAGGCIGIWFNKAKKERTRAATGMFLLQSISTIIIGILTAMFVKMLGLS